MESFCVVFSAAGFLSSPVWMAPVMQFVEHHCLVFDMEEENKIEYTLIHEAYREMIEQLLEGFIEGEQSLNHKKCGFCLQGLGTLLWIL
jgi:hypothetical protein